MIEHDEAFDVYKQGNNSKQTYNSKTKFKPKDYEFKPNSKKTSNSKTNNQLPFGNIEELSDILIERLLPNDIDSKIRESSKNIGCYALNEILSSYLKK
jgi:hypothetical protein